MIIFKKKKLIILYNIFFVLIILLLFELIFGNWLNNKNLGNLYIPINKKKIIYELPYKSDYPILYTTDKNGFRANKHDLKSIELLIIGGSTTEEKLTDDNKIWTKILEKNSKKIVLNAGIGGQTSFGHVKMFEIWFSKFDDLKPKYILFYIGINDALFMIEKIKSNNLEKLTNGRIFNSINRDNLVHINYIDKFYQKFKNNSALYHLTNIIKGNYISYKYKINYGQTKFINTNSNKNEKLILSKNEIEMINIYGEKYIDNLNRLLDNSNIINSKPIFITQTISKDHWLYKYLLKINSFTKLFCKNKNLICIDLASEINLNSNDFYDGIHTNPVGSEKIATFLTNFFKR